MTREAKALLSCRCGAPFIFTEIRKCADCGTPLCFDCARLFRGARYCKADRKRRQDEASAHGQRVLEIRRFFGETRLRRAL